MPLLWTVMVTASQTGRERRQNQNADKTACPRGHPYDEANTYVDPKGWRRCRACKLADQRSRRGTRKPRVKPGSPPEHHNRLKTHCPKGHPYEGDNLYVDPKGNRRCRECKRLSQKAA